jgi:chromosome segregation ATPase
VLARNRALEQDNKSLEFQLNEVSTKSNQLAADHRVLEQDKHALEFQLNEAVSKHKKLEADILSLQEQMEEQERNALDAISQRESKDISSSNGDSVETNELQHEIKTLTGQLGDLTTQLDSMHTSHDSISADRDQLITRVAELEKELKDERMSELRDEVTSLHKEREQLDLDNEELLVQLGLMQQSKLEYEQEVENELTRLRGQVATLQDNIVYLQRQLDETKGNNAPLSQNELDALVEKLHKENAELQRNITKLSSEKGSLEDDVLKLTDTVNALEQQQGSKQTPDDAQVHQLKSKIAELEAKLSSLEQETSEMQQLKTQIHDLERRLSEKEHDIMISTQAALEQNDVDHTSQVEENSSIDSKPTNDVHEEESKEHDYDYDSLQDLFADEVESDDYLRQQIVILAQALERSELQRAAVLDRLTRERKGNADSLRQLGESVKRFYSTVRSSGST